MPSHAEKRILPYSSEQLFDLVMDIDKYPEFLPWCLAARVNERKRNELGADVIVGYGPFREKFTSRVRFKRPKEIEVDYLQGPLTQLQNKWTFRDMRGGQCEVDFFIDFALKASKADIAVSATGIAGPGGATDSKPVGLVYIGVANGKTGAIFAIKNVFGGNRTAVRLETVETALSMLREEIRSIS